MFKIYIADFGILLQQNNNEMSWNKILLNSSNGCYYVTIYSSKIIIWYSLGLRINNDEE